MTKHQFECRLHILPQPPPPNLDDTTDDIILSRSYNVI